MDDNNFDVIVSKTNDDFIVETGFEYNESEALKAAIESKDRKQYSVTTNSNDTVKGISLEGIDVLASGIHHNKSSLIGANQLIIKNVDEDGLMGYTYLVIVSNSPTEYTLNYKDNYANDEDKSELEEVKRVIERFNEDINIKRFIKDMVGSIYLEGTVPVSLRFDDDNRAIIDTLPLSLAYPSDYKFNGDRLVEVDVKSLSALLSKPYLKKKNKSPLYFKDLSDEIRHNFCRDIVTAYENKDAYTIISPKYGDILAVNTMGKKYGVSPFFRALRPLVVLRNIESADVADSAARSKKIIFQKLRKELMEKKGAALPEQALAHNNLMEALKTNLCAYTAPAFVESLEFVSSKSNNADASKQLTQYMTKYIQSLGINFVDTEISNYAGVNVSVGQILNNVNLIIEEIERVLNKFYKTALEENDIDPALAPTILINNAQTMDFALRMELSKYLYSTLNCSRDTALKLVDVDIDDEYNKRAYENDKNYDEVFYPRQTAATLSSEDVENGRPKTNVDTDKQAYDKERNSNG